MLAESPPIDLQGYQGDILVILTSGARTTATGVLAATILDCATSTGTFVQIGAFTSVSTASSVQVLKFTVSSIRRYLKVLGTITVPPGETGAFPYAVRLVGLKP
jgi:hypothetical protein